jgi:hypothetical protein
VGIEPATATLTSGWMSTLFGSVYEPMLRKVGLSETLIDGGARRRWACVVAVAGLLGPIVTGPAYAAAAESASPVPQPSIDISLVAPARLPSPGDSGEVIVRIANQGNVALEIADVVIATPDTLDIDFVLDVQRCDLPIVSPGESVDVVCEVTTPVGQTCAPPLAIIVAASWGPTADDLDGFRVDIPKPDVSGLAPCSAPAAATSPPTDTASTAVVGRPGPDPALSFLTALLVVCLAIVAGMVRRATAR